MDLRERIEELFNSYVALASHSNTSMENDVLDFYLDWFHSQDYFKAYPSHYGFYEIEDDYLGRKVPWALVKGKGSRTMVMIHHFDTVDTLDYGQYHEAAYKPKELAKLFQEGMLDMSREAKADLDLDEWIFGRGVADAKAGGAIHMALMERYAQEELEGSILFLALPDETNLSAGMRAALHLMDKLKEEHDLDFRLMLNSQPQERKRDDLARVYDGSVGKLMPLVYVRGELAHAGQAFGGLSPINLLSEIVRKTEYNPRLMERLGVTTTPPPVWLNMKDRKQVYDVSLPAAAAGYLNILTLDRSPKEVFVELTSLVEEAMGSFIEDVKKSHASYLELAGLDEPEPYWEIGVRSYDDIYREALRDSGEKFLKAHDELIEEIKRDLIGGKLTAPEASLQVIERTLDYVDNSGPMVVIAMAPPYYPNVSNEMLGPLAQELNEALEELFEYSWNKLGQGMELVNYYTGISDLSYAMLLQDITSVQYLENNMPLWREGYYIALDLVKKLSMPVLNLGPWGKDINKHTERVYARDLYEVTPTLIDWLVRRIIGK